ncbi:MAG TPA: tRNA (adenosine(37)-N6)-threonylcarbamoyltransferase complex transferase subunit TsaD [Terriglobia bacterium]|nr:tRNA (adenosine(37)-N6)-threonylcarbamoyltransferase complex transferase subunit TsaD [Terriglobia bacterium]
MLVLGIETSCDETAAAVVRDGKEILSNVIYSQVKTHTPYGGVVPELASREHLLKIRPIVDQALADAHMKLEDVDGIAATSGPGLIGSLLVGLTYAKALAFSSHKPLAAVNHIEGHIYSVSFEHPDVEFPALALVVSGGHTNLFWVESESGDFRNLKYELVGRTRDDAAGEAYDKVAKLLGLGYPGGPVIDRLAKTGNRSAFRFSIPKISDHSLDFSFSGIKTAVLQLVKANEKLKEDPQRLDLCASFQESVVNMLWSTTLKATQKLRPKAIMLSGGVAANSRLREAFAERTVAEGLKFYYPRPILTTDNAAMIAAAGTAKLMRGETADIDENADPNMRLA